VNKWIPSDAAGLQATHQSSHLQPVVGTWSGEIGNLLNFRGDGTARWRSSESREIGYLEWTLESNELAIYQYASKRSLPAWLGHDAIDYSPTDRLAVVSITATQFQLRDRTGKTLLFTRTRDPELESSP